MTTKTRRLAFRGPHMTMGPYTVAGEDAHYLRHVLRVKVGDPITLFDGKGTAGQAFVTQMDAGQLLLNVETLSTAAAPDVEITLAVATPKGDRADLVVEKLTELGVAHIIWLHCERSVRVANSEGTRMERWHRIIESAAQQCGRATWPSLEGPVTLVDFINRPYSLKLLTDPGGQRPSGLGPGDVSIIVGPEGGLTATEVSGAQAAGYQTVRLSSHILRVETAAIAAAAVIASLGSL